MRLNKYIANQGLCTRREAEALIKNGVVRVDGITITNPGHDVAGTEVIVAQGVNVNKYETPEYYLINKEKNNHAVKTDDNYGLIGLLKGTVAQQLEVMHPMPYMHTGLHVITNDQEMIARMSAEEARIKCTYQVALAPDSKGAAESLIPALATSNLKAVIIEDDYYDLSITAGPLAVDAITDTIIDASHIIARIDRMTYASMTKKDLKRGWNRKLTDQEVIMLKHFV